MSLRENAQNKAAWTEIIARNNLGQKVNVHKYDLDKLVLALVGDEHIGSKQYAADEHRRNLDWIYEHNVPIILMGDELETATKTSVGAGVFEQDDIVQGQLERCVELYKPLADEGLILGNHVGNHEARVYKHSGTNLSKILSTMLNIPYLGVGAAHIFRVGKNSYTMYTTHGSSGARMPHTKIANVIKMQSMIDVDIYAAGHVHQLSHHVQNFYKVDKRNKTVVEAQKHYILTGSYLNHWGGYAHVLNMEPAKIGSPKVKLGGEERSIRVSL